LRGLRDPTFIIVRPSGLYFLHFSKDVMGETIKRTVQSHFGYKNIRSWIFHSKIVHTHVSTTVRRGHHYQGLGRHYTEVDERQLRKLCFSITWLATTMETLRIKTTLVKLYK
jgi:hypothetical protein